MKLPSLQKNDGFLYKRKFPIIQDRFPFQRRNFIVKFIEKISLKKSGKDYDLQFWADFPEQNNCYESQLTKI